MEDNLRGAYKSLARLDPPWRPHDEETSATVCRYTLYLPFPWNVLNCLWQVARHAGFLSSETCITPQRKRAQVRHSLLRLLLLIKQNSKESDSSQSSDQDSERLPRQAGSVLLLQTRGASSRIAKNNSTDLKNENIWDELSQC